MLRTCPSCAGTECIPLLRLTESGERIDSQLVRCVRCGDARHWTHWKTPETHAACSKRLAAMIANINAGREALSGVDEDE